MKKAVLSIFFLLIFSSFCFAAPAISFRSLSYDLGVVSQEAGAVHVFDFMNKGDQELVIQKVSGS